MYCSGTVYIIQGLSMKIETQVNSSMREHNKKMSDINAKQKNSFKKLLDSGIQINYKSPQIKKLICQGIPSVYRPCVWSVLVQNIHGITPKFYQLLIRKAAIYIEADPNDVIPDRAKVVTHLKRIQNDIQRTYPQLKVFRKDNQNGQYLFNILSAWTVFRQDVGYLQGMSQIAGLLLLEMKEFDAFVMFCTIMTNDVLFVYENLSMEDIQIFQHNFDKRLKRGDENYYIKLKNNGVQTRSFLLSWVMTLFTRTMSLDMVSNLWDILFAYDLCPDIIIEVAYHLLQALKIRLNPETEVEQILGHLKNFKLSDAQAFNVLTKIKQSFR